MTWPADVDAWARVLTMLPILGCSVVGLALAVAKWLQLRRMRASAERWLARLRAMNAGGDDGPTVAAAQADPSIAARLVEYVLVRADASHTRLAEHVAHAGGQLARRVERGLDTVALIATLGPLLGLFGTVVGIVIVFDQLAGAQGVVSPSQLAGGIGTALYTTVAGLIVGMCALVSHRVLASRADDVIAALEALGQALVDVRRGGEA